MPPQRNKGKSSMTSPALKKSSGYKILLINPWIYDFTAYDFWLKPLGLLYMASIIEKYTDAKISFIDCLDTSHPQQTGGSLLLGRYFSGRIRHIKKHAPSSTMRRLRSIAVFRSHLKGAQANPSYTIRNSGVAEATLKI